MDNAAGLQDSDVIYVDTNTEQIESLPATAVHRPVDLEIVAADKDGYIGTSGYMFFKVL